MKIDYTSDLHLDYIMGSNGEYDKQAFKKLLKVRMGFRSTQSDVLIIAGDLGHYNNQIIAFLKFMAEHYYKHVIFVHGNHDLYLLTNQMETYNNDSFRRLDELKQKASELNNVHFLDGEVVEIDGVKFAGSSLWYDYSYSLHNVSEIEAYYFKNINDSKRIMKPRGYINNLEYAAIQKKKLLNVIKKEDPQIIISHIPPDIELCEGSNKIKKDPSYLSCFYCTDTSDFDPYIKDKIWIFGHIHNVVKKEKRGCTFLSSPYGYYMQERANMFGRLEV